MSEKVKIIILSIVFVIILVGINSVLKGQQNVTQEINIEEENMSMLQITKNNFEEEVLKSAKPVLIDFYADWCGPCKILSPIVEEIASTQENVKVCKINIDSEQDLAIQYGVMSIPTLVVIKNGQEVGRRVGVISRSEILDLINQ